MQSIIRTLLPGHTTIGVEITDVEIKMCEVHVSGSSIIVTNSLISRLPEGTMNDGRIHDIIALQQTFQKMLTSRKWRTRHVHFAIPSQTVMIRMMKLPAVPKAQLTKLVQFEIKHNIHLPFENPYYDFIVMKQLTVTEPNLTSNSVDSLFGQQSETKATNDLPEITCDIMLVAAPTDLLTQYVQLFKHLDLKLGSMEIKSLSIIRTLEQCYKEQDINDKVLLLVDVNETSCDLTIIENQSVKITRNVQTSFTTVDSLLKVEQSALDSLFQEFTNIDHSFENASNDLISEIERLMNFYRYSLNNRNQQVDNIYVCGDLDHIGKLIELMSQRMSQQVIKFEWPNLEVSSETPKFDILPHVVTLGLSLRGKH